MNVCRKCFALFYWVGITTLAFAIGFSVITHGSLFFPHPFLTSLRAFGVGTTAAASTLWIALCRQLGGRPGLNPLFDLIVITGTLVLGAQLAWFNAAYQPLLMWSGLGISLSGVLVGVGAQLISPSRPCTMAAVWPEGGEKYTNPYVPALELHRPQGYTIDPEDLTVIEGIGPKIQDILNQVGMISYQCIALSTPEKLRQILTDYHLRAPVDTRSWPKQAELAARGLWDELTRFQKELKRGRMPG